MQRLMPDSPSLQTERRMQPLFSKTNIFSGLAMLLLVMAFDAWLATFPNREGGPERAAAVRFEPIELGRAGFAPLRLAGAWRVSVDDPRFGGVSALALDGGGLLALTDSGSLVWVPKPGTGVSAVVRDLPDGPGDPGFKRNRDSEALARDPQGRGWWVAFENRHQLWLYDRTFRRTLARVPLPARQWRANRGIEAMAAGPDGLLLLRETGRQAYRLVDGRISPLAIGNPLGSLSDAAILPDGRLLLVVRNVGLTGVDNQLAESRRETGGRVVVRRLSRLTLGPFDNVEALAIEPRRDGGARLWLMTDNDFRKGVPTLLVALDLPPER